MDFPFLSTHRCVTGICPCVSARTVGFSGGGKVGPGSFLREVACVGTIISGSFFRPGGGGILGSCTGIFISSGGGAALFPAKVSGREVRRNPCGELSTG